MGRRASILVVDDDVAIRRTLSKILEKEGYLVETVESGGKAIEASNENFFNAALIDIRLLDMEGTDLLEKLKETVPKMVKIIVTGYPSLQNAIEAVNKGADGYVLKPFKVENVLNTIQEQLKKQREAKKYSQKKVAEFIETRAKELETITHKGQK